MTAVAKRGRFTSFWVNPQAGLWTPTSQIRMRRTGARTRMIVPHFQLERRTSMGMDITTFYVVVLSMTKEEKMLVKVT